MARKKKRDSNPSQFKIEKPGIIENSSISLIPDDTPLFCFKYFDYDLLRKNKQHETDLCFCFLEKLQRLSDLGWNGIRKSRRHDYGMEKIPITQIKLKKLPSIITPDIKNLHVFRAKKNLPFIGLQEKNIFHVLYIEPNFGVIYDHE